MENNKKINKNITFQIKEEDTLLNFLLAQLGDRSRTTVKSYLSHRQISVNNCITSQFDLLLKQGDTVVVNFGRVAETFRHPKLKVVFEDDYLIVVEKGYGLLSISTDKQDKVTAYNILSDYVKRSDESNKVFVLHRLDRETSGLMVFSKDQRVKYRMQSNWDEVVVERKYYAVVEGLVPENEGLISTYLTENKALKVFATTREHGKIANTAFKVLSRKDPHTLMELELETGRKNQIRCHMEYINHSIIGDKKYGARTNPLGRVALHAGKLSFIHPVTGKRMDFSTPMPNRFLDLFYGKNTLK